MWWLWCAVGAAIGASGVLTWKSLRGMSREFTLARARESFRLQREQLEAKFLAAAAATGKPKGLEWKDVACEPTLELVRDSQTGQLLGLVPVSIEFSAVEGGPMEGVEAVANLRYATAVFIFEKGHWLTNGRALFNMHPDEAIKHFAGQFQKP
jgi:hypothetical protein